MLEGQDLLYGKNMKVRKGKRKGHVKLDVVTDRNNNINIKSICKIIKIIFNLIYILLYTFI